MAKLNGELEAQEYEKLKGMMLIMRKQHEGLTQADKVKLERLYQTKQLSFCKF